VGALHRRIVFRRAMERLSKTSRPTIEDMEAIFPDLIRGWGNEDWSAQEEFLASCSKYALKSDGPLLECGTGLSTIVLGVIAQKNGNTVWSLEHNAKWAQRVARVLKRYAISSVHLCVNPLKDYGEFAWYDPPFDPMPPNFSTVICDGPPGDTKGGRYGLLPIMRSRLKPGAHILLDDSVRESERNIAARWANELNTDYRILGSKKPYILLTIPGASHNDESRIRSQEV
jgi:predicted O-methyltransferase YrrM